MSEINATSIADLPSDPTIGGNVSLVVTEKNVGTGNDGKTNQELALDQNTISQIVNGLQQASLAGATALPSRDIPTTSTQLTNDPQIQPNYIPTPQNNNYINEDDDDINTYYNKEKQQNSLDNLYDEIQTPLLLAVLYFLFQLPIMKKNVFYYLPFLCNTDGNYNFNGLIFSCGLFGFIYYMLSKSLKHFSKF
jgi:hypothetical protein